MKKTILLCIFVFSLMFQGYLAQEAMAEELTLRSTYSTDVNSKGVKYYHDGSDWVGRGSSGALRAVNRWNISGIDPSWTITSVEVRFYAEGKAGSPGTLSITRYGTSYGEDDPGADTGAQAYSKINGTPYASLPEPSSGSWTNWINLGSAAVSDITWCRMNGLSLWSAGLKASDAIEASTTIRHVDFSEDNEANNAQLRITYMSTTPPNVLPTASITSITPNPATQGQTVTFTGSGEDLDGTITAYEWTSSINGPLSTASSFSTSSLSAGTHTIAFRVKDNNEAWSNPATSSLTVSSGGSEYQLTLGSTYSTDVNSKGVKYYHDGSDWVGRGSSGALRAVNRWNISGIDPSWTITSVEVRFYAEGKAGSPGTLSITRYGTSYGEDDPGADTGAQAYSKINGTPYASLPEPSSGSWTNWINLGSAAVSDITWCRMNGLSLWSAGLKASDAIEASTTIRHVDFSEDNEANNAQLRITYTSTTPPNVLPTASITSITPNPATQGQTVTFTGSGEDLDGTITAYEWTSSINGPLSTASSFSTSSLSAGTHTIAFRVKDNNEAWSNPATSSLTVNSPSNQIPTASITSITPNPATQGQTVTFTGSGEDLDGTITAYEWTSSINGPLSTASSFSTSSLSAGTHTIAFRVKDNNEAWSNPATSSLTVSSGGSEYQLTLGSTYSTDVNSKGVKYYHDGSDWVGRGSSGALRAVNRWNISGIDPSWTITSVEVRFYAEGKAGSPGTLSITRYGTSYGEDDPGADTGAQAYSKINGTPYASLPEPSSGSWTNWINLGSAAVSDITWCRMNGLSLWSAGLKASDAIEASTTIRHVDFSEDNEANNAQLRITYTSTTPPNVLPTASITSITPNPATQGQTVTFTGSGEDLDGTITAYEWTSSINGPLSTASSFSTSSLSAGTHTIAFRVKDNNEAWSNPATRNLTISTSSSGTTEHIYICLGYRLSWLVDKKTNLENLLRTMGAQKDGDVWRYMNQALKKEFFVHFVEDMNSMKFALQEEGAHVLFLGHSNYGLGPVFGTADEIRNQFIEDIYWLDDPKILTISSPWVGPSVRSIRTDHTFPDWWPDFQDGTSAIMPYDFNDPDMDPPYNYYITYRIPGDPNLYKVETTRNGAIERFPDSNRPAWYSPDGRSPDPTNPDELQYFIVRTPTAPSVNVIGNWTWSREVTGYYRENYFYSSAGTGQNKVEWLFTIQEPGDYKIFGWWPAASHHTSNAQYTVNNTAGSSTFIVDQTKDGGQWNEIGQFYFEPGNYSVVLSDQASSGRVVADGVKITAVNGVLDRMIDNMVYPPSHYGYRTILSRKDLDVRKEDMRYSRLFYDSCNSGNYFLDTLNRGIAFFTVNDSSHLGFNAYIKAYLEGKSNHEIWTIIQSYSTVYDYYDFNKLPSQQ